MIILFMKPNVVIYGITTESYSLACTMSKNASVYIIDESNLMAIFITSEIASSYPTISSLLEDEPLLSMIPLDTAISNSRYVFFAPLIRKIESETTNEVRSKFKGVVGHMAEKSSMICCLPTGIGGNDENISILEHVTGFEVGKSISYFYYPLSSVHKPQFIGSFNKRNDNILSELLNVDQQNFVHIQAAEHYHVVYIISKFSKVCSILEVCKLIKDEKIKHDSSYLEYSDIYLDDIIYELYDLYSIKLSLDTTPAFMYLINGSIKSITNYVKRLIDVIKLILKKNDLKSSKTKIALSWKLDYTEIRGDKLEMLSNVVSKLRDYVVDVESYTKQNVNVYHTDKTLIVIACSKPDYDYIIKEKKDNHVIIIKANPLCEVI